MRISRFFIERPIFAAVVSLVITIIGAIGYFGLGITQLPEIIPPTITVTTSFPGASAQTVADTVAAPIEQEVNGVEGMIYMASQSTSDGNLSLTVTFDVGTDIDKAQVLVQNRVSAAERRLPDEVRRNGLTVRKRSPDLLLAVHLLSPDKTYDQVYISNYGLLNVRDKLMRLYGVADVSLFGVREYSMRIWLDPERIALRGLTAEQVLDALRAQNVQVAGGALGEPPVDYKNAFQVSLQMKGRLQRRRRVRGHHRQDGCRRARRARQGHRPRRARRAQLRRARLRRQVLRPSSSSSTSSRAPTPYSATQGIKDAMAEMAKSFPKGLEYRITYNPTEFVEVSIQKLYGTILEATVAGGAGRAAVPQDLARDAHPGGRHPGVADRHVRGDAGLRVLAQHAHPVRAGAGGRHRRRRRHRRGRERRAQAEGGPEPARGLARLHGRGGDGADRHRAGAAGRVHPDRLHRRHHRPVLPPIRDHDRDGHRHLAVPLADAQSGAVCHPVPGARMPGMPNPRR